MPIDERWNQLDASDWDAFAQSWIAELRGTPSNSEANVGHSVVMMNFTARPEHQWQFILAAITHASDDELGHIAAGPMEHLLGKHGTSTSRRSSSVQNPIQGSLECSRASGST